MIVNCGIGELRLGDGPFENCAGSLGVIYGMVVFVIFLREGSVDVG
jgi:hypothetical protein